MKSVMKYSVILLLLMVALPLVVLAGSTSVTAIVGPTSTPTPTPTPTPTNFTVQTFAPFYQSIFGVHIFPGADPIGAYSININPDYHVPHQVF